MRISIMILTLLLLCLLCGCKTTTATSEAEDTAAQPQDPKVCLEACDQECKNKWASSPLMYEYCFDGCLNTCTQQ